MEQIDFALRGEFIPLDSLLKATGAAPSGAMAKIMVAEGRVRVDGQDELRKTAKIRAGQVVQVSSGSQGLRIHVLAGDDAAADSAGARKLAPP